jgi:hypothetical protein
MSAVGSGDDTSTWLIKRNATQAVLVLAVLSTVVISAWSISAPSITPPGEVPIVYVLPPVAASIVASIAAGIAYITTRNVTRKLDSIGPEEEWVADINQQLDEMPERDRVAALEREITEIKQRLDAHDERETGRAGTATTGTNRSESASGTADARLTDPGGYPSSEDATAESSQTGSRSSQSRRKTSASVEEKQSHGQLGQDSGAGDDMDGAEDPKDEQQPYRGDDRQRTSVERAVDEWRSEPRKK